jgi:hypothetical protein
MKFFVGRTIKGVEIFLIVTAVALLIYGLFYTTSQFCNVISIDDNDGCSFQMVLVISMEIVGILVISFLTSLIYKLYLRRYLVSEHSFLINLILCNRQ